MLKDSLIYVAGHKGTAGSAILEGLQRRGFTNILTKTHAELDLTNQKAVDEFFKKEKPEFVFLAAAKLAHLGTFEPALVLYENLMIQNNVLKASFECGVKKLLFFGSAWMYPKEAKNPITEEALLEGRLDSTALAYALAKIAGLELCKAYNAEFGTNFLSLALANLYGGSKDFRFQTAKVLPAMLRKFHLARLLREGDERGVLADIARQDGLEFHTMSEARAYLAKFGVRAESVEIWGSGRVVREFIHSDDLADAAIFLMQEVDFKSINSHLNVGSGEALSIKELAFLIKELVGFSGELKFDSTKPDSTMDRVLDSSKIHALSWRAKINLKKGVQMMYQWYSTGGGGVTLSNKANVALSYLGKVA
ncbi:NAD-dependent epimerase/dehydratase family protein [Campylobacter helveticus]|uniref:NAD-dependent epimerase/dehydratase family protein n=1 Tax=Campylobacter helveticus TaxID=28898 RepID=UPI002149A1FE|nr:NAD-dependent epimerase/dehydratase family protein [Campylobacter helveticus]